MTINYIASIYVSIYYLLILTKFIIRTKKHAPCAHHPRTIYLRSRRNSTDYSPYIYLISDDAQPAVA